MPPLPPASACLKVVFEGTNTPTVPWNCIIHSKYSGTAPTTADLNAFCTSLGTVWNNNIAPLCGLGVELTKVTATDLSSQTSPSGEATMAHAGTRTGSALGGQVCLVSSWAAPLRYRGGHPRNYWPGGTGADIADLRSWSTTSLTAFQAGFQAFLTAFNATNVGTSPQAMVLLSYKSGKVFRPTPLPVNIAGVVVHPRLDTQRRRLGKET